MNDAIKLARSLGKLPDRYWYQLNGKTAQTNYAEQRRTICEALDDQEDEAVVFVLNSEVKIK